MQVIYPKYLEALISGGANSQLNGVVKLALLRDGLYTYSAAHQFYSDISSAVVGTPQTLTSKSFDSGKLGAVSVAFTDLGTGIIIGALVLYIDTGVAGTSRLIFYDNEAIGLPLRTDGGVITVPFDSQGIIQF
jgi:hypothetical protein